MKEIADILVPAVAIGAGATFIMDVWLVVQKHLLGIPTLDYRLVGRWIGYLARGERGEEPVPAAPPIHGEAAIGWATHYAIGIVFAATLLVIWGPSWAREPSITPALVIGLSTVLAPFLILQPALGAGIAASRTPRPNVARARSVATHLSFAIGLFVAAKAWSWLTVGAP